MSSSIQFCNKIDILSKFSPKFDWHKIGTAGVVPGKNYGKIFKGDTDGSELLIQLPKCSKE